MKLKSCPFCGTSVIREANEKEMYFFIRCPNEFCGVAMSDMNGRRLVESWNSRAAVNLPEDARKVVNG
jgi:hypothetical protein